MRANSQQRGSTLLEALIATAITAMIAAAAGAALKQGAYTIATLTSFSRLHENQYVFERTLRNMTDSAVWVGLDEPEWLPKGSSQEFSFVHFDGSGELIRTTLEIVAGGTTRLVAKQVTEGERVILDSEFRLSDQKLELRYLTADRFGNTAWSRDLTSNRLPSLISLGVPNDTGVEFRLDAYLPAQSPLICQYDPVARICRNTVQ